MGVALMVVSGRLLSDPHLPSLPTRPIRNRTVSLWRPLLMLPVSAAPAGM